MGPSNTTDDAACSHIPYPILCSCVRAQFECVRQALKHTTSGSTIGYGICIWGAHDDDTSSATLPFITTIERFCSPLRAPLWNTEMASSRLCVQCVESFHFSQIASAIFQYRAWPHAKLYFCTPAHEERTDDGDDDGDGGDYNAAPTHREHM